MLLPITPFEVRVINPGKSERPLKKGAVLTVRAVASELRMDGMFLVYFLVWNAAANRMMLEDAGQFEPIKI